MGEIPLNQWFLVEALSPPLYLCYLTPGERR